MSAKSFQKKEVISIKENTTKSPTQVPKLTSPKKIPSKKSFFLGASLIIVGAIILLIVIFIFLINQLPYITRNSLPVPILDQLPEYTNKEAVNISGNITKDMSIVLYINGNQYEKVIQSSNGKFSFNDYKFTAETNYVFKVIAVKKSLLNFRSNYSKEIKVTYDKTPPRDYVKLIDLPKETEEDEINLKGSISESGNITVWVKDKKYSTNTDNKGSFLVENVILTPGKNDIAWRVTDQAGNVIDISKLNTVIMVESKITDKLNGNGISTKKVLPEAAGELENALATLSGIKMMPIFALIAVIAFTISSFTIWTWHRVSTR